VLAFKRFSVDQFTIRPFNYLNSAVLAPFEIQGLDNGSLFTKTDRLGVVAFGVPVTNPPIGHSIPLVRGMPLLRRSTILPRALMKQAAKTSRWATPTRG
jgi:hypothetical protein